MSDLIVQDDALALRELISVSPNALNAAQAFEGLATLLHKAAQFGSINCLRQLIELGANLNAVTFARETPLHYACHHGRASCAEALCRAGANCDALDEDGLTPFHFALRRRHRRVVRTLLRLGVKPTLPCPTNFYLANLSTNSAWQLAHAVKRAGDWSAYVLQHKRILVGLVTKCRPLPDDAAGLIVEFMCLPGGF